MNKQGFSGVMLIIFFGVAIVGALVLFMVIGEQKNTVDTVMTQEQVFEMGEHEVSESSDASTLEKELEETVIGNPADDFSALEEDLSDL